ANLIKDMERLVVGRLGDVLANDTPINFPKTEEKYGQFHAELAAARQPQPDVVVDLQGKITALLTLLREIRSGIGQGLDAKKLITQLEALIKAKTENQLVLDVLRGGEESKLKQITVTPPNAPVSLTAGQKTSVRVPVAIGPLYNGTFGLKLEPSP